MRSSRDPLVKSREKRKLLNLLILLLILVVFWSVEAAEQEEPLNVTITPKPVFSIDPSTISETIGHGSSTVVDVTVSNHGNVDMTNVTISKSGSIQDWMNLSITNLDTIIPLGSKEFNITISVPSETSGGTYSSEIFIECNEMENVTVLVDIYVPSWGTGNGGNGGNGNGGNGGGVTTTTTTPVTTAALPTTTSPLPTTRACAFAGQACSSDTDCCYGYCCDNVCSDEECEGVTGINTMYIALIVIGITAPTSYYVYKKYLKKKVPVEVRPAIPARARVRAFAPVARPTVTPPRAAPPVQRPAPPEVPLEVKFQRELASLRDITQKLRVRGYDTSEVEEELSLAENALRKNLPELSVAHLNRIKQLLRKD